MTPHCKLVIVGPVTPYRGGIAQYTESLWREFHGLSVDTELISFKRQYPKFLYPGDTDKKDSNLLTSVKYMLDSNNPLTWHQTAKHIVKTKPDLVLLSWWTLYWQPAFWYMARYLKKRGVRTVLLCHNVYDHSAPKWKQSIAKHLLRPAFGYIVHAKSESDKLKSMKIAERENILIRQHPVYDIFPAPTVKKVPKSKVQALFIGLIRPYKGLDILLNAYQELVKNGINHVELTVVGEVWGEKTKLQGRLDELGIRHDLRFVDDQEMVDYITKSDVVVLPYLSATGSGVIPVAYNCGRPVVATNTGGLAEVVQEGETGWLVEPGDSSALANILKQISKDDCRSTHANIRQWVKENSWENMAKEINKKFVRNKQ